MQRLLLLFFLAFFHFGLSAQNVMNLLSDTVRISNAADSGELVVRNHSRGVQGVLYNKGNGVTEFRVLKFIRTGDSTLMILGTDTMAVAGGAAAGNVYLGEPDVLLSATALDTAHMLFHWWKTDGDLYQSARIGVIGDSQGKGDFPSAYQYSIVGRLQNFIYAVSNNDAVTNYCQNGYNSRRLAPTGSNPYVDNQHNITKALADGNKIIILCNTSNDFYPSAAGGVTTTAESMANTLLIADACQKAGADLFVISSFPRNQLDPSEWDTLNVMAGLLNQKFGRKCAYVYHLVEDPANPNQLNPTLQVGDNIHLNDAGANIVYSAVRDLLTSYYVSNTTVLKYELQQAHSYNGTFSDLSFPAQPNNPTLTLPADSNFYRVRIVYNNGYYSKWSNIIQGTQAHQETSYNKPPLLSLNSPPVIFLPVNTVTLTANASSSNTNGTISSYSWFEVMGSQATINSPGAATTTISGLTEGSYVFRCQVTDSYGVSAFADAYVTVSVPDSNNTAAKFNFNVSPQNISGWLDVSGGPLNPANAGRTWTYNQLNIGLTLLTGSTSAWGDFYNDCGDASGSDIPDAGGFIIPAGVISSAWYSSNIAYAGASSDQFKVTGLSPVKKYKLKFYCSLRASYNLNATPSVVVVGDNLLNQKQVNAVGNTSNVLIFRGIVPNTNGEIPFFIGALSGVSQFGMLNGLTVQEDSSQGAPVAPTVTSGGNKTLQLPNNSTNLSASANDPDAAIISVAWTQVSGPAGASINTPAAFNTSVGNLSQGTYVFRCTVTDTYGASGSADVQVVVSAASTDPMLNVVVTRNGFTLNGWTVLAGTPHAGVASANASFAGNLVNISTVSTSNWTPFLSNYTSDATGSTIDDGGGFLAPTQAQQGDFFNENAYDPAKPQVQISGLPAGTYTVTMFGSLAPSFTLNTNTEFRVNGSSPITINTLGNTSHAAVFPGITIGTNGTISLYFNPTTPNSDNNVGMLNFFIIDKTN